MKDKTPVYYDAQYLRDTLKRLGMVAQQFMRYTDNEVTKDILSKVFLGKYNAYKNTGKLQNIVRHLKRLGVEDADRFLTPPEKMKIKEMEVNPVLTQEHLNYFKFAAEPFQAGITSKVWFSAENQTILDTVVASIGKSEMLAVIGSVGAGKSTLFKYIKTKLSEETNTRFATIPKRIVRLAESSMLTNAILGQIGEINIPLRYADREDKLVAVLDEAGKNNIKPVIFLDEAHLLSESCWKTIKMLWEEYIEEDTPVSMVAFAQPGLRGMLALASMREVRERLRTVPIKSFADKKAAARDVPEYIGFKLRQVGVDAVDKVFTPEAVDKIARVCDTPLRVNLVCNRSLICAFDITSGKVTLGIVNDCINRE